MSDVTFFWVAFGAYLVGMFALGVAAVRRGAEGAARLGRGLVWIGLLAHTVSIVWRGLALRTQPLHQFVPRLRAALADGPAWQGWTYGLLLGLPVVAVAVGVAFRRRRPVWLLTAGAVVMGELILLDFLDFARLPVERVFEYLSLASWSAALGLVAFGPVVRLVVVEAALAAATALLAVFAAIQPQDIELHVVPALQSYWLFIHVSLTSIGFAIFGIAYVVAGLFVVRAFDRSAVLADTRRRCRLAAALAILGGAALVAPLTASGVILPYRKVAYAPHELAPPAPEEGEREGAQSPESPEAAEPALSPGLIQVVRYRAAQLGAGGTAAYVLYWVLLAFLRPRDERSGVGSYQFVVSSTAVFLACLALGGVVRRQERAIRQVHEQRGALVRLHNTLLERDGRLTGQALRAEIERMAALSRQARRVLSQARWLPLTLEDQPRLSDEPVYRDLQELYERTDMPWTLPIRYKDIKQIGRALAKRAETASALMDRLRLPADRDEVVRVVHELTAEGKRREERALLPRRTDGKVAAFVGLALVLAVPLALLLVWAAGRLRDRLPPAERLDRISYVAIAVGYPVFTFGALFAGAIWAHFAWGSWWGWDPKEVGSLVAWVLYTIYLHQRYREAMSPRAAAVAGMLGFLAAVLSLAGNAFLGGLHAYA